MANRIKCSKCERTFSMAAHLARHMNTIHGPGGSRKASAGRKKARGGASRGGATMGRPSAIATKLGLRNMGLQELAEVIEAARAEGRQRLMQMRDAFSA